MNETEKKKEYELSYLLTAEISENKIDSEIDELKKIIADNGGGDVSAEPAAQRRLAYPIKKQNWAHFGVLYFTTGKEDGIEKIKNALAFDKKILRFFITAEPIKSKPAPVSQSEAEESAENAETPAASFDKKLESILNR